MEGDKTLATSASTKAVEEESLAGMYCTFILSLVSNKYVIGDVEILCP